MLRERLSNI